MKKVYCAPQSETIVVDCSSLLAASILNNKVGNGVQLSNERQGDDWDDEVEE